MSVILSMHPYDGNMVRSNIYSIMLDFNTKMFTIMVEIMSLG